MGPGPTPLRNETEIDTSEGEITDDVEEEYEDDGLALVSTNSRTPPTQIDVPAQPTRLLSIDGRPGLWTGVAIGLFIVKVMSLFRFCSPYLPSATIMWLLLALAGADILLYAFPQVLLIKTSCPSSNGILFPGASHHLIPRFTVQFSMSA